MSVQSKVTLDMVTARDFRALVLRAKRDKGSLVHLVGQAGISSLCGAYPIEALGNAGVSDEYLCPACIEHLRAIWATE